MAFDPLSFFLGVIASTVLIGVLLYWKGEELLMKGMQGAMATMSEEIDDGELGLDEVEIDDDF